MRSWIKFSLKNAGVIFIAMLMVIAGGIYSVKTMKMESMPNVDIPYIVVQVPYIGATPDQGLEDIGKPLESALSGIKKLDNLYIEAHSNVVVGILEFNMSKNMDEAEKDVTTAVASIKLPAGAEKPAILKDGPSAAPVFTFALSSETANQSDMTQFINERIKPALTGIDGAGSIDISGETEKEVAIKLDPEKMKQNGITYETVKQTLLAHNFSFPAGQVNVEDKTFNVQADFKLNSVEDVKKVQILAQGPAGMKKLSLSDVATVNYSNKKETVYTRLNEKPAVLVEMLAIPGSNTVEVVEQAKEKLDALDLPAGYKLTKLFDTSKEVKTSVDGMLREVLLGTLFAVIVTFLFLRNIRATIVAVLSIPLSILASMITLKYLDYSLNMMTLAGIAVAVGRVIDDSIVVIENVYRRTLSSPKRDERLVLTAAKEVGGAITSSTLTTIAVFGPLSFVPGIVGKFFAPFGITVIVALAFSLIVSLTVVPLLAKLFLLRIKHQEVKETLFEKAYRHVLSWVLTKRAVTIVLAIILFAGSLALAPLIPQNFLPQEKAVSYRLIGDLPAGTSLEKANKLAVKVEDILKNEQDIKHTQTIVSGEHIRFSIDLNDGVTKEQTNEFEKSVRAKVEKLDASMRVALSPVGIVGTSGLALMVEGGNAEDLETAGKMITDKIKGIDGLENVESNLSGVKEQLQLKINDQLAAEKGLSPIMIAGFVRELIAGDHVAEMQVEGKTTSVNLSLNSTSEGTINDIMSQKVTNPMGQQVSLSEVATLTKTPSPSALYRLNQQPYVQISGRITTDNSSGVQAEVDKRLKTLDLPKGISYHSEGQAQAMNEGFTNMMLAMAIAVVLVFIVMLIAFGNMLMPVAILSSLPFLFSGGLLGLYLTNQALGMPALVGFLMLIGIVVTNAIVLMERVKQNEKKGMAVGAALLEAGKTRLRPILMTALATIGALLPLALSSDGGLISRSLAIVVISGLLTSTLLTLVVVPTTYHVLHSVKGRLSQKKTKKMTERESA
ncbi:efflux RND transporter permease subunit [Neobacillus vireti]|uniref:Acriflavin resistance protein n=1 Tax=Neobacillus vireti LMG 21834 TaxID=1131730 RepID=A0AB94IMQ2_9BACI|nr:efflux RND transporter permease subunit [Neobacillus vireti]ETI68401.1 acriflavin resistance protein [Neobacillus vireti LMG 21834]KLT16349.1 acriflavin resistance protein [Neobacillus vireti]